MVHSLQETFINNLRFYRKKCGFSQESLSDKLGKGTKYINKIESGGSFPTVQVIEEISSVLGIQAAQLFEEESTPRNIIVSDRDKFVADVTDMLYQKLSADMRAVLAGLLQRG